MNNSPSNDLISAYADDRLSPEERAEVDALLESSSEARAELDAYRKLGGLLKNLPQEPAASDLASRVMSQAERESLHGKTFVKPAPEPTSSGRRWLISAASLASAAAILFLAFSQFNQEVADHSDIAMSEPDAAEGESVADEFHFLNEGAGETDDVRLSGVSDADFTEAMEGMPDRFAMELGNNGLMRLIDPQDLKTAEIGDTIDGWQFSGDRVVVVQLTVVDREEVLNSMQILLSELSIPAESGNSNSLKDENGGFYAVYVEAEQEKMATALRELKEDMNIEEMLVSANLDSRNLNPYFEQQGYSFGVPSGFAAEEEVSGASMSQNSAKPEAFGGARQSKQAPTDKLDRPSPQKRSIAAAPATQPAEKPTFDKTEVEKNFLGDDQTLARLPEPPPLPEDARIESSLGFSGRNLNRQVQLRLPEELGNQMIVQGAQPSISNSFMQGKKATRNQIEAFQKELDKNKNQPAPSAKATTIPAPKSRAFTKSAARPVQVLFLLTPEPTPAKPVEPQPEG